VVIPAAAEDEDWAPTALPLPQANRTSVADLQSWQAAEGALAAPLASVAAKLGALDERLHRTPEGWRLRLALIEAANLSWLAAERVSVERLAFWQNLRLNNVLEDTQLLARCGWALRRLSGGVTTVESSVHEITLAHRSGRTPKQLIALLARWPQVSAPMAAIKINASRAAIQRNLNDMVQLDLIREVTGQGRYRVWTACL